MSERTDATLHATIVEYLRSIPDQWEENPEWRVLPGYLRWRDLRMPDEPYNSNAPNCLPTDLAALRQLTYEARDA